MLEYGISIPTGVAAFKMDIPRILEDAENDLTPAMTTHSPAGSMRCASPKGSAHRPRYGIPTPPPGKLPPLARGRINFCKLFDQ